MVQKQARPGTNPLARVKFEELVTNPNLYLCGEPIKKVFENQFFESLNYYTHCGFCYGLSAFTMLMLKDDPTAKIVQGEAKGVLEKGQLHHCWVEVYRHQKQYVIDPSWFPWRLQPIPRDWYYNPDTMNAKSMWECQNNKFWQKPLPSLMFEKCSDPRTSWVLPQLIWCFTPPHDSKHHSTGLGFRDPDQDFLKNPKAGQTMFPPVFRFNNGVINTRIVKELMRPGLVEVSPRSQYRACRQSQRLARKVRLAEARETTTLSSKSPS